MCALLLRRGPAQQDDQLRIEDLELDTHRHRAVRAGQPLHLTAKEFLLLAHLVRSVGEGRPAQGDRRPRLGDRFSNRHQCPRRDGAAFARKSG